MIVKIFECEKMLICNLLFQVSRLYANICAQWQNIKENIIKESTECWMWMLRRLKAPYFNHTSLYHVKLRKIVDEWVSWKEKEIENSAFKVSLALQSPRSCNQLKNLSNLSRAGDKTLITFLTFYVMNEWVVRVDWLMDLNLFHL